MSDILLDVKQLQTRFDTPDGEVCAVNNVNFQVRAGESIGIVGESGSGKTQIFLSIMGLLAKNGKCSGEVLFNGQNLLTLGRKELNKIRGVNLSMIFQDPMTSLNPYLSVERQMTEVLIAHKGMDKRTARKRAIEMLDLVRIPEAARRISMFPHEFSGGMRQRVMIAMSLLCDPQLLIADEPTTALDVTVQAQILDLLNQLRQDLNMAIVLVTHDFGVVAGLCDRVMVMYGGRVAETGSVNDIFYSPKHPYSRGLLQSMPRLDEEDHGRLSAIQGQPPNLQNLPQGCAFQPRCDLRSDQCAVAPPPLQDMGGGSHVACYKCGAAVDSEQAEVRS